MFALNLRTRFASLLDNQVGRVTLDNSFDARLLVPRYDEETCEVRCDAIVISGRKLDRLYTGFGRAFAMEGKRLLHAVPLGAFVDPLVDRPKNLFVAGGRVGEVHEGHCFAISPECQTGTIEALATLNRAGRARLLVVAAGRWL